MGTNENASLSAIRLVDGLPIEQTKAIEILNQLLLPHEFEWIAINEPREAFEAIKSMKIRGAPAIASLAALSIACGLLRSNFGSIGQVEDYLKEEADHLVAARPTAVNLKEAVQRIRHKLSQLSSDPSNPSDLDSVLKGLVKTCKLVWEEDLERNKRIGFNGARWLLDRLGLGDPDAKLSVLTVCNTGSLATSGYGTALGIITSLKNIDKLEHVYYMQTGPYMQGSRLTSLELHSLNIDCTMVCDSAAAYLIHSGKVDAFIAGADRIASNGDTANKISTYQITLLCRHARPHNHPDIPVIIAAPVTTLDLEIRSGDQIEIEQRPSIEACTARGKILNDTTSSSTVTVLITPENVQALNPAFDVTPSSLIDGIITELGVIEKEKGSYTFDIHKFVKQNLSLSENQADLSHLLNRIDAKYRANAGAYERNTGHSLSGPGKASFEPINQRDI